MVLYSVMKIFMNVFWGYTSVTEETEKGTTQGLLLPLGILTGLTIALGLGTELIHEYADLAAAGLNDPKMYVDAVLGSSDI
jgi:multicomponent Na+:H+ antiporter subunit D